MSTKHETIGEALSAAMAEVQSLAKDRKNNHGNYKYAGIEQYLDHLRPVLGQHGVVVVQECVSAEVQEGFLVCQFGFTLLHGSEKMGPFAFIASSNAKMGAQAYGAAASYGLKFFLRSLLLVSADDVDADQQDQQPLANGSGARRPQRQQPEPRDDGAQKASASVLQLEAIRNTLKALDGDEAKTCAHFGVERLEELSRNQAGQCIRALRAKLDAKVGEDAKAEDAA